MSIKLAHAAFIFRVSLIAALGGLLFGFDIAIISGTIPFIRDYFALNESSLGFAVGVLHIGCIFGVICTGWISDHLGRKIPLIMSAIVFALSAVGTALAQNYEMLVVFRFLAGIGVGAASMLSPMYIAEITPARFRGKMVSFNQLTIVIGILLAYLSNYLFLPLEYNWRWMFASAALPSILFFLALFFVPESPRWLVRKGKEEKSLKILEKTGTKEYAAEELKSIKEMLAMDTPGVLRDLLAPKYKKVLLLGILIAILQQFTGINTVIFYAPLIFERAGMNVEDSLMQSVVVGLVNFVFTIVAIFLVDKLGRKKLLLIGSLLMGACLLLLALFFRTDFFGIHVLVTIFLFVAGFALTWGPVAWVLIAEIFPNSIRGIAMSVATAFLWLACFTLSFTFPVLMKKIDAAFTFLMYALFNLVGFLVVKTLVPETKNKSLEEIERDLIPH